MAALIGDLVNRFNVFDFINPLYTLETARGIETVVIGDRTFAYVIGSADTFGGINVFEVMSDGTVDGVQIIERTDSPGFNERMWDATSVTVGSSTFLYVSRSLGIVSYEVAADGTLTEIGDLSDDGTLFLNENIGKLATVDVAGVSYLIGKGQIDDGISVFSVAANGALTNTANLRSSDPSAPALNTPGDVTTATISGNTFIFVPSIVDDAITSFQLNPGGTLTEVDSILDSDAPSDLALDGAIDTAIAVVGGITYLYVAGFEDDGISVFSVDATGTMTNVQNYNNGDFPTFFINGPYALNSFTVEGATFLTVSEFGAGTNDTVFFFGVSDDGSLTELEEVTDTAGTGFGGNGGNAFATVDGIPLALLAGQTDNGFSTFELGAGDDTLTGTGDNDSIIGVRGDDSLTGLAGDDSISGGIGNDTILGGVGSDTLLGGDGNDVITADPAGVNVLANPDITTLVLTNEGSGTQYAAGGFGGALALPTGDFTIEMLYEFAGTPSTSYESLWGYDFGDPLLDNSLIARTDGSGEIELTLFGTTYTGSGISSSVLQDGQTHRVSLAYDQTSGDAMLYIDGVLEWTVAVGATGFAAGGNLIFGMDSFPSDLSRQLSGEIADMRIWSETRSATEILNNAFLEIADPVGDADLKYNWRPDASNGSQVPDVAGLAEDLSASYSVTSPDKFSTFTSYDDYVADGSGDDSVVLGAGDDTLRAGDGQDTYEGGEGHDFIDYFDSTDSVNLILFNQTVTGGFGAGDTYSGFESGGGSNTGDDRIIGTLGNNTLLGNGGDDYISALGGDDSVDAGAGNDTVRGGNGGDNTLDGGADNDMIDYQFHSFAIDLNLTTNVVSGVGLTDTLSGFESVIATSQGDSIIGSTGANEILGRGGVDLINSLGGGDTVDGGAGDDIIVAGVGANSYDGGADHDFINYANSNAGINLDLAGNTVSGGYGENDTIASFESARGSNIGDNTIRGTDGDNAIYGGGGNDYVNAGGGNDTVELGAGNDVARGGSGNSSYDGGADTDFINYVDSDEGVNLDLAANTVSGGYGENDTISSFESARGSATGDDTIYGTDGANLLFGTGGEDRIYARDGDDTVDLGDGDDYTRVGDGVKDFDGGADTDYISYYDSTGGVTLDFAANTASGGWADDDTVVNFESASGSNTGGDSISGTSGANTIRTYGGNDTVFDRGGADSVNLGSGNDYLYVGGGVDTFDGGSGDDYIDYAGSSGGVNLDLEANTASGSRAASDIIEDFESAGGSDTGDDTISGTSGANTIDGNGGNDLLFGRGGDDSVQDGRGNDTVDLGAGNDRVRAGGGADSYDGGADDDLIDYSLSSGGVNIDLAANTATGSWANNDTVVNFESVIGSATGNDTVYGTAGANYIDTQDGDDRVYARDGDDTVKLGDGEDYARAGDGANSFDGGADTDYISYYDSTGGVTLDFAANTASGGWASDDTVTGFESASGSNTGGDSISGTDGANTIRTYGGNDTVYDRGGADSVNLGSGNDYLYVGGGVDTFVGGSGNDYIDYAGSSAGVELDLAANTAAGSRAASDIIDSFESAGGSDTGDDTISGTSGANTIDGNGGDDRVFDRGGADVVNLGAGDDYVRAGGGADTYDGGADDDYISYYDSSGGVHLDFEANTATGSWANNDVVLNFEGATGSNTGNDTLYGADGESVLRGYGGNDRLHGRGGDDSLVGGSGDDSLYGSSGADTMRGGDGADRFDGGGGAGTDLLYGDEGADVFHFDRGEGDDVIKDFEDDIDRIEFDNFSGFTTANDALAFATETGGDVFFNFGVDGTVLVENATIAQLTNDIDIV